jgi:hypothetical protein
MTLSFGVVASYRSQHFGYVWHGGVCHACNTSTRKPEWPFFGLFSTFLAEDCGGVAGEVFHSATSRDDVGGRQIELIDAGKRRYRNFPTLRRVAPSHQR